MKRSVIVAAVLSSMLIVGCGEKNQEATSEAVENSDQPALETVESKVSYLIGYNSVSELANQGLDLDEDAYIAGIREFGAGGDAPFTPEEAQAIFAEFQQKMQAEAQAEFEASVDENAAKSAAFLAENGEKEGVMTTESGLQYKVLEAGEGDMPSGPEATVQVHYEGRLINGEVFDSSIARGTPVEFALNQVIPGWTEGLQLMPEGSKWELYIPSELAYGASGSRAIGPNEALIFIVELLQANYNAESE